MSLTYNFQNLKESAQEWALQQVSDKHPVGDREKTLDELVGQYEYNRFGDIVDYSAGTDEEFAGGEPEYREED